MQFLIRHDVCLRALNTFGLKARAARFVTLQTVEQLMALRESPEWDAGPRLILGGGSNILFAGNFSGLVVQIAFAGRALVGTTDGDRLVRVAAGENWHQTVMWTLDSGWPGLENLASIPGTCGAAPIQNIGAYGVELAQRFDSLEAFDVDDRRLVTLSREECRFAYRDSLFKQAGRDRYVITAITLRLHGAWTPVLEYGDVRKTLQARGITTPDAQAVASAIMSIRAARLPDPALLGNAGSFFKNPLVEAGVYASIKAREPDVVGYVQPDGSYKLAAAWLIERCGWKGRSVSPGGEAAVHDRQALVLVTRGQATGAEVLALAAAIRHDVFARFGVELEAESLIVGI